MTHHIFQSLYLIALAELDQSLRHSTFDAGKQRPAVSRQQQHASDDKRPALHLVRRPENFKSRMTAKQVILFPAIPQTPKNASVFATAHIAMVEARPLVKSPGLPSLRLSAEKSNQVDPSRTDRPVAAYFLKTFASKHLACARNVRWAHELNIVRHFFFAIRCAGNTQLRIRGKLLHQKRKVIRVEGDVRVQIADHVIPQPRQPRISLVESSCFPSKTALLAFRHPNQFNPIVSRRVFADDVLGTVSCAVAHDDPPYRPQTLRYHRLDRLLDQLRFVPRRSNQNV